MNKLVLKEKCTKILASFKQGLQDVKMVFEEGNYKLFVKQGILIVALIFGYRYVNNILDTNDKKVLGQIDAVQAQKDNEKAYLENKKKLLELEPRFPDVAAKNDWLLRQVVVIFRDSPLTPKMGASQTEDTSHNAYVVTSIPVEFTATYNQFGNLIADIESREDYLRVSEFSLAKNNENLGLNTVHIKMNTIFPKEKLAASLFKDVKKEGKKS